MKCLGSLNIIERLKYNCSFLILSSYLGKGKRYSDTKYLLSKICVTLSLIQGEDAEIE